ncbi:MAG TPA: ABC transporter ATP-binding protein [Gaiellaceae bacterium]|nr:ABC transporter ATP-binding protein [Gaiellaceae bacterium]
MDEVAIGTAVRTAGDTGTALVRVDGVRLGYWVGDAFHTAVGHATFDVRPREKMIVIGPSGCGKSTLLKAIAGFIAPVGGSITVSGRKTLAPGPDRAVVFQEFDQLFPWRTVIDNVAYPLRVNGRSRRSAKETAREFLELTHLGHAADRYPHQLSGGMKQRVAIARALALEPTVLLMDEPFGALDAITRQRLQAELNRIVDQTNVTVLFVTHSIEEALVLGDRVVVLGNAPSSVLEIVDLRDLGGPETVEYSRMRGHLRALLAVDEEDALDEEESLGGID